MFFWVFLIFEFHGSSRTKSKWSQGLQLIWQNLRTIQRESRSPTKIGTCKQILYVEKWLSRYSYCLMHTLPQSPTDVWPHGQTKIWIDVWGYSRKQNRNWNRNGLEIELELELQLELELELEIEIETEIEISKSRFKLKLENNSQSMFGVSRAGTSMKKEPQWWWLVQALSIR